MSIVYNNLFYFMIFFCTNRVNQNEIIKVDLSAHFKLEINRFRSYHRLRCDPTNGHIETFIKAKAKTNIKQNPLIELKRKRSPLLLVVFINRLAYCHFFKVPTSPKAFAIMWHINFGYITNIIRLYFELVLITLFKSIFVRFFQLKLWCFALAINNNKHVT